MFNQSAQSIIIFVICVILLFGLFCTFIATVVYRYKQNREVHQKELDDLSASLENTLLKAQLEMQEHTFQNISREIHDNIGQQLSLAKLLLNTQDFEDRTGTSSTLKDCSSMISSSINTLGDISRSMSSELISNYGLIRAIEDEIFQLQKSNQYNITLSTNGEERPLDAQKELMLFRIVQESLQNIIKHANASLVTIYLHYNKAYVILTIQDNGKGFGDKKRNPGNGLKNIRTRTSVLFGTCSIDSGENGTVLRIDVPLNKK